VPLDIDRLLDLVRRETGAVDARVTDAFDADDARLLRSRIPGGSWVVATFEGTPDDRETKQRRLDMLVSTFDGLVGDSGHLRRPRPPVATSLRHELESLRVRAGALNVIVIDANSPIVWGAARPEGIVGASPRTSSPRVAEEPPDESTEEPPFAAASRRALQAARALPEIAALRKGRHVRYVNGSGEAPLIAHSFAGIYLLVMVLESPIDELRAERAILDSIARIERLVLALPPIDPEPGTGGSVIAIRRGRRR
jgi:hypothetical protein